ncbi:DUF2207 domain-containing protein [Lacisediminihabitans sp.]|jgi:uncharacterized membrane protein YgcG|uniref:DUF2207 domain-containing protein n=1 Tax=Lacisediminihabitans sp. TaxID=2787631 RepID=UPI002F92FC3F
MKRLILTAMLAAAILLGVAGPASAGVDDFSFSSFDGQYTLGRDAAGRSVLTVVETLVAVFPQTDQNHGIRRELVDTYDGHPTDLTVKSVTDGNGGPRGFTTETNNEFLDVTIASDSFVHGAQTYVITYEQHNVTRYFADTRADEFYWDTNGTGWAQPFGEVTATVHLAPSLLPRLTGKADAASGAQGASGPATVARTDDGFAFGAKSLGAGQNLTFAIGFAPGTFTPRDSGFFAAPWPSLSLVGALGAIAAAIGGIVLRLTRLRDAPGRGIIIPEYLPPKGVPLLLSSTIAGKTAKANPAQILDLAVSGRLRVLELEPTGFSRKPGFALEFVTAEGANPDETEFLHALFGDSFTPGEQRTLKKPDQRAVKRITALMRRVRSDATAEGYRRKLPAARMFLVVAASAVAGAVSFIFGALAFGDAVGGLVPAVFIGVGVLGFVITVIAISHVPLEPRGAELREYLKGLDMYISLAEADRLRYLQSPQGAERAAIPTDDKAQLVKLNERLLPYAVLFGNEREWARELGRYYEELGQQPTWYAGRSAFNAALFASSIGSVSVSASSAYSASSGGSGGGAASGGGGGGGGGGGV